MTEENEIIEPKPPKLCPSCLGDTDVLIRCDDGKDRCVDCAVAFFEILADRVQDKLPIVICRGCGTLYTSVQIPVSCPECDGRDFVTGFAPCTYVKPKQMPEDW